jgi:hypothetical protein
MSRDTGREMVIVIPPIPGRKSATGNPEIYIKRTLLFSWILVGRSPRCPLRD